MVCKASFVVKCCYISYIRFLEMGRIAQVVEQLTLNQRVQGSSPCAPTILSRPRGSSFAAPEDFPGAGAYRSGAIVIGVQADIAP